MSQKQLLASFLFLYLNLCQFALGDIGLTYKDGSKVTYYFDQKTERVHRAHCTGTPVTRNCPGLKFIDAQTFAEFAFRVHAMELIPDPWNTYQGLNLIQTRIETLKRDEVNELTKGNERERIMKLTVSLQSIQAHLAEIQSSLFVKLNEGSDRTLEEGIHDAFETVHWTNRPMWFDGTGTIFRLASPGDNWKSIPGHCKPPWGSFDYSVYGLDRKRISQVFGIDWVWLPNGHGSRNKYKFPLSAKAIAEPKPTTFSEWGWESESAMLPILCQRSVKTKTL